MAVSSPTNAFFDELSRRGQDPALGRRSASLEFDIIDGKRHERWLVVVTKGDVDVTRDGGQADCVLHVDRALFDDMVEGRRNGMAAILRGAVKLEGDLGALALLLRLVPSPAAVSPAHPDAVTQGG